MKNTIIEATDSLKSYLQAAMAEASDVTGQRLLQHWIAADDPTLTVLHKFSLCMYAVGIPLTREKVLKVFERIGVTPSPSALCNCPMS